MRGRALAALVCATALAGCGLGAGEELEGAGVTLRVTRDFGHESLGAHSERKVREDQTVMRMLTSNFDVDTRFGGRFVQSIDGLKGAGATGRRDWFFFVNGVESDQGAAEYELSPGDRVQWDYRTGTGRGGPGDRGCLPRAVPPRPRGQAAPGAPGVRGRRLGRRADEADDRLEAAGVPTSSSTVGAPNTETVTRLVVAPWPRARIVRGARRARGGARRDRRLRALAARGSSSCSTSPATWRAPSGPATARRSWWLCARARTSSSGSSPASTTTPSSRAPGRSTARKLRDAFAVAVTGDRVEKLPLEGR